MFPGKALVSDFLVLHFIQASFLALSLSVTDKGQLTDSGIYGSSLVTRRSVREPNLQWPTRGRHDGHMAARIIMTCPVSVLEPHGVYLTCQS